MFFCFSYDRRHFILSHRALQNEGVATLRTTAFRLKTIHHTFSHTNCTWNQSITNTQFIIQGITVALPYSIYLHRHFSIPGSRSRYSSGFEEMHPVFVLSPARSELSKSWSTHTSWYICAATPEPTQNGVAAAPTLKKKAKELLKKKLPKSSTQQNAADGESNTLAQAVSTKKRNTERKKRSETTSKSGFTPAFCTVRPTWPALKRVLVVHCGGTFGMDVESSFDAAGQLRPGTGGSYRRSLRPGKLLGDILDHVPELQQLADLDVHVAMNKDSARVGPQDWIRIAKLLHRKRNEFDSFVIIHGTDTM